MQPDNSAELEAKALLAALMGAPFNYNPTEAAALVKSGSALGIIGTELNRDTPGNVGIITALAERVAAQAELLGKKAQRNVSSEPFGAAYYFVCSECNGAFAIIKGDTRSKCACGKAYAEASPLSLAMCTGFGPIIDVTNLVKCGKLTARHSSEEGSRAVVFGVCNKTARGVELPGVHEAVTRAAEQIEHHAGAAVDYLKRAAEAGALVIWTSHYHTEGAGVERTDTGDYLKRRLTGDARFCATVVARKLEDDRDGSLIFRPVNGCARCNGNHAVVAFWKLTQPVTGGEVPLTHFGHCPSNGEPIMLFFSENSEAERVQQVRDMKPIQGPTPTRGPSGVRVRPVGGTSPAFNAGYDAGFADSYRDEKTANPHAAGTREAEEWNAGYNQGHQP